LQAFYKYLENLIDTDHLVDLDVEGRIPALLKFIYGTGIMRDVSGILWEFGTRGSLPL
jgi:hypothetical protein